MTNNQPPPDAQRALEHVSETMTTLCEWFGQREAGKPTTNSEAAMFARCDQAASYVEGVLGLSSQPPPDAVERAARIIDPEAFKPQPINSSETIRHWHGRATEALAKAAEILSAPPAHWTVPDGWKLVPTGDLPDEIIEAGDEAAQAGAEWGRRAVPSEIFNAMIAAAPTVPTAGKTEGEG